MAADASQVEIYTFLSKHFLFSHLNKDELNEASKFFEIKSYGPGEPVTVIGEEGNRAYIVVSGEVVVTISEDVGNLHLGKNTLFGEFAVAFDNYRWRRNSNAGNEEVKLLEITKEKFEAVRHTKPFVRLENRIQVVKKGNKDDTL